MARNVAIFQDKSSSPKIIAKQGLDILSYFPEIKDTPTIHIIMEEQLNVIQPWDYFDESPHDLICGGGESSPFPFLESPLQNPNGPREGNKQLF